MITIEGLIETYLLRIDGLDPLSVKDARTRRDILADLMSRHPEQADALADFAATAIIIENSPDTESLTSDERRAEEAKIVRRGMETAARLLSRSRQQD